MTDIDFYTPENANLKCRYEEVSGSGLYKLIVTPYTTKEGCWNYSQGLVFKQGSDEPIADIRRNYSAFPATFIEDHPNGHHYLVAGADYQGQTVIELDTGRRRDFVPEAAKEGHGFCWADHRFDPESKILVVDGCFWAAPYMFCFYDFSDPIERGWPELEFEGAWSEGKWPEFVGDGLIRTYRVEDVEGTEDQSTFAEISTYRRKGNELRFVSMWLSQGEKERRRRNAQAQRDRDAWEREFKATDPLYLEYKKQVNEPGLRLDNYETMGITHDHSGARISKPRRRAGVARFSMMAPARWSLNGRSRQVR